MKRKRSGVSDGVDEEVEEGEEVKAARIEEEEEKEEGEEEEEEGGEGETELHGEEEQQQEVQLEGSEVGLKVEKDEEEEKGEKGISIGAASSPHTTEELKVEKGSERGGDPPTLDEEEEDEIFVRRTEEDDEEEEEEGEAEEEGEEEQEEEQEEEEDGRGSAFQPYAVESLRSRVLDQIREDIEDFLTTEVLEDAEREAGVLTEREEQLMDEMVDMEEELKAQKGETSSIKEEVKGLQEQLRMAERKIKELEQINTRTQILAQQQQLHFQTELDKKNLSEREATKNSAKFELQVQQMEEKLNKGREEQEKEVQKVTTELKGKQKEIEKLKAETSSLSEEQSKIKSTISSAEAKVQTIAAQNEGTKKQNEILQEEVERLRNLEKQVREERDDLQRQTTTLQTRVRELELNPLPPIESENELIIAQLRKEVDRLAEFENKYQELQHHTVYLQEVARNTELLKEELVGAKTKLDRAEQIKQTHSTLQVKYDALVEEREKWLSICGEMKDLDVQSPTQILQIIADLQKEKQLLLEKNGTLGAEVKRLQLGGQHLEEELKDLKQELKNQTNETLTLRSSSKTQEHQLAATVQQCQSLKALVDSYSSEKEMIANYNLQKAARVAELEKTVAGLEKKVSEFESTLSKKNSELTDLRIDLETNLSKLRETEGQLPTKQREVEELREANTGFKKELDDLARENAGLYKRVGRGDFDPSTTKVLHFINNPERQAWMANDKYVMALKTELEQSRLKVASLEDAARAYAAASSSTLAPSSTSHLAVVNPYISPSFSSPTSSLASPAEGGEGGGSGVELILQLRQEKEITGRLQQELRDTQLKSEKVKEALKNRIHGFRKTCFEIFGYQIDLLEDRQYRLKWMRDSDPQQSGGFLLKSTKEGLELLETPFSTLFPQEIVDYLQKKRSLPLFFNHVTTKLLYQPKFGTAATSSTTTPK